MCLLAGEDDGSRADLLRGAEPGLGQCCRDFEVDHILVAFDGEGGDVGFGDGVVELLEEGRERDGAAGSLIVGGASGSLRNLLEVALPAEAAAATAEAGIAVVDGV